MTNLIQPPDNRQNGAPPAQPLRTAPRAATPADLSA